MLEKLVTLFNNFILRQFGSWLDLKKKNEGLWSELNEDEVSTEVAEHPLFSEFTTELQHWRETHFSTCGENRTVVSLRGEGRHLLMNYQCF